MVEIIVRVLSRKDGIKYLIVPKKSKIKPGEYVVVSNNFQILKEVKRRSKDE